MKCALAVLVVFYLLNRTDGTSPVTTKWLTQPLNHFDSQNAFKWKMHYMVNEKYFKEGGPIFIYVGGEVPINAPFIEWGLFTDIAAEHEGILFYTGHRFYGKSRIGRSLTMDNMKFLNSYQALADLANFINVQRLTDPRLANSKVILAGCSYAGSLAVWFNRLYPDLVDGTWAISAPILAKADFFEYLEITGQAMKILGSPQCYDRIQNGIKELEIMFYNGRGKKAADMLKLCDYFDYKKEEDIWRLFRSIQNLFATLVTNQNLERGDVAKACKFLMKRSDDLRAIVDYFLKYYKAEDKDCKSLNYYGNVFYHNKTSYDNIVSRQWLYQICNEFGWFQGTTSKHQPFGKSSPTLMDWKQCYDIFGDDFTEQRIREKIDQTNKIFGGLQPNVKNIYMTYGSLDPWSALGPSETDISTVVPKYSHCAHIESISDRDSPEMIASKQRVQAKVREWLGSENEINNHKK